MFYDRRLGHHFLILIKYVSYQIMILIGNTFLGGLNIYVSLQLPSVYLFFQDSQSMSTVQRRCCKYQILFIQRDSLRTAFKSGILLSEKSRRRIIRVENAASPPFTSRAWRGTSNRTQATKSTSARSATTGRCGNPI